MMKNLSRVFLTAAAVGIGATPLLAADPPTSLDYDTIRAIPVQHDGRCPPLDTVARDVVKTVTGTSTYRGQDPVAILLGWTFDPVCWKQEPMFHIGNAELRGELELSPTQTDFSFEELINHNRLRELIEAPPPPGGAKPNALQSKVRSISGQLVSAQMAFMGDAIRPIPDPDSMSAAWLRIKMPSDKNSEQIQAVSAAWVELGVAFLADDSQAFSAASSRLAQVLGELPAAYRPDAKRISNELAYNSLRPFRTAWKVMLVGTLLAALAMVVRRRWFDFLVVAGMVAGFGVLTWGLSMRWDIAGRIPASNMFESLLFLSWGMGAFAIVSEFLLRHRMVPLTASAMGALTLVLADVLPSMDSFIRPIAPVLSDTVWMSIHVPIIMVSYSVLALAVLFAHVQLVTMAVAPRRTALAGMLDSLHYWYVYVGSILLFVGIITGSMWAASSWGRYWGWDPKEVWSLVAFMGYMTIMHVRVDRTRVPSWAYVLGGIIVCGVFAIVVPKLQPLSGLARLALGGAVVGTLIFLLARSPFATAVKSIVAFWMILMTYVGVNYVLGTGLHSYGFGTGAVVHWTMWIGGTDLAFIALCWLIYVLRQKPEPVVAAA